MQSWFPGERSDRIHLKPRVVALIAFYTTRNERLLINGFLLPIIEHCSKIFLSSLTDRSTLKFLFKTLVKPLFSIAMRQGKKILEMRSKHIRRFGSGKKVSTLDLLLQRKEFLRETDEVHIYV